jgi:tRNA threonylcarbamoyladenosine biosynthesis protein TsaE
MNPVRPAPGLIEIELASEDETARLGRAIATLVEPGTVIGLVGPLGAGKTRLVRAIAEALGVAPEAISSPTFVLIQEYDGRLPVFHFDTYRLPSPAAFENLGAADYWDQGVSLVEWADRVAALLPEGRWTIALEPTGPTARKVRIEPPPDRPELADRLVARLAKSEDGSADLTP